MSIALRNLLSVLSAHNSNGDWKRTYDLMLFSYSLDKILDLYIDKSRKSAIIIYN